MPKHILTTLDECDEVYASLMTASNISGKRTAMAKLLGAHELINFEIGRGRPFWRARKCTQDGFENERELTYPPAHLTATGRLNDRGAPCLYLSTRHETAFAEINAVVGDYIHLEGFRVLADKTLRILGIGEWLHVQKTGYLRVNGSDPNNSLSRALNSFEHERGLLILYIDALLGSILADPNARDDGYQVTRLLGAMAYRKIPAVAMFYPSVQASLGMNLAVKARAADSCLHGVSSTVVRITGVRKFGIYEFEIVKTATGVDSQGCYEWQTPQAVRSINVYRLTKTEFDAGGASFLDMHSQQALPAKTFVKRLQSAFSAFRAG